MVDQAERLLTETRPYPVPEPDRFIGPDGEPSEYLPADDLRTIAARLIRECSELAWLADHEVSFFWRKKGGKSKGKATLGACQKPSGLLAYYAECSWIVWLAADNLTGASYRTIEATIHHELQHCCLDDHDKAGVSPHDWAGFTANIRRFGAWLSDYEAARDAWQQLALEV